METTVASQYTLISRRNVAKGFVIKEFLHRHLVRFISYELGEDPDAAELIALHDLQNAALPLLICANGQVQSDPELYRIAQAIGDVRRGSVKRMASAIGDRATAVSYVDEYLSTTAITNNQ